MAAGPLDLRALNHASFVVRDVEESTNFYKCALLAAISYALLRKYPGYGSDTQPTASAPSYHPHLAGMSWDSTW